MELTGLFFYLVSVLIAGGIYAILCLALNVQWGMGGLFNAGIAGFFAVGAYTSAIVTTAVSTRHLGGFDLPIPFGLAAAAITAGLTGWAVAKICVRLKSDYLAMASIGPILFVLGTGFIVTWRTHKRHREAEARDAARTPTTPAVEATIP